MNAVAAPATPGPGAAVATPRPNPPNKLAAGSRRAMHALPSLRRAGGARPMPWRRRAGPAGASANLLTSGRRHALGVKRRRARTRRRGRPSGLRRRVRGPRRALLPTCCCRGGWRDRLLVAAVAWRVHSVHSPARPCWGPGAVWRAVAVQYRSETPAQAAQRHYVVSAGCTSSRRFASVLLTASFTILEFNLLSRRECA
jgi:hypothetical protein